MLNTASYYAMEDWKGRIYRVSRGHPRGRKTQWETLPFLYPSRKLLTAYQGGDLDFAGLRVEYRKELEGSCQRLPEFRGWLISATQEDFTLLCFERADEPCHRQILAQWLLETVPGLEAGELR